MGLGKDQTPWGEEVSFKVQPDGTREVQLMLDGREFTSEVVLNQGVAYRLGRALLECAEACGLPAGFVRD